LLDRIFIKEITGNFYEVNGVDAWSALQNPERLVAAVAPAVRLIHPLETWPQFQINSQAVDGVLTRQGFTVTDPKYAERAGIQAGDTIVRVNGHRVEGFASLYAISQDLRRDIAQPAIRVEIQRQNIILTKTYRLH
jgi:membrane-associated protease RseP (regulator of RpoE activity)